MPIAPVKLQQVAQAATPRFRHAAVQGRGIASGLEQLTNALDPTTGPGAADRKAAATATIRADFDASLSALREEGKDIRSIAVEERGFMRNNIRYAGFSSLAPGLYAEWAGEIGADDVNLAIREALQGNPKVASSTAETSALYEKMVGDYAEGLTDERTRAAFSLRMNQYRPRIIDDSLVAQGEAALVGSLDNAAAIAQTTFALTTELDRPLSHKAALARIDQKVHEAASVFPLNELQIDTMMLNEYLAFYLQPENLHLAEGALRTLRDENVLQDVGLRKTLNAQLAKLPALQLAEDTRELNQLLAERKLEDEQYRTSFDDGITQAHYDAARGDISKTAILNKQLEADAGFMYTTSQNNTVLVAATNATSEEDFAKILDGSIAQVDASTRSAMLILHRNWRDGVSNPVASAHLKTLTQSANLATGFGGGPWRISDPAFGDEEGDVDATVHHEMIGAFYAYLDSHRDQLRENPQKIVRDAQLEVEGNFLNRGTADPKAETDEEKVFRLEAEQAAAEAIKVEQRLKQAGPTHNSGGRLATFTTLKAREDAQNLEARTLVEAEIRMLRRVIGRRKSLPAASPASAAEVNEPEMLAAYGRSHADVIDSIIIGER